MSSTLLFQALTLPFFWLLIFLYITGVGFAVAPFKNKAGTLNTKYFTWFWYGLGITVAFLQVWNLFFPINFYSSLTLLPIAIFGIFKLKKTIIGYKEFKLNKVVWTLFLLVIIFLSTSSLDNSFIYDTLVYHFYTLKWFNIYPVTKGMGNLFIYLGFNQSFFLFPAFLNSFWNNYRGACATNGLLALIICAEIIFKNANHFKLNQKLSLSSIVQLLFLPLCINAGVQNLSSPTPDVFVNLFTFKILSDLISCVEEKNIQFQDIFLLSFSCVMGVILKMSFVGVAIGVLVVILWWLYTLKLWDIKMVCISILFFLVLIIPWAIRGIISSGYIAFPLSFLGMPVDWKMPKEELIGFSAYIKGFARTHLHGPKGIEAAYNYSWLPNWIKRMLTTVGFMVPLLLFLGTLLTLKYKKAKVTNLLFILLPVGISIVIWFFTAPDVRFAVFTFWGLGIISLAYLLNELSLKWMNKFHVFIFICSFLIIVRNWNIDLEPLGDLPKQNMSVYTTKSGLKINIVKNAPTGDEWQIGDCDIPCSVFPDSNLVLKNNSIQDGFYLAPKK